MRQLLVLLFVGLLAPAIRVLPGQSAAIAGEAGWLSTLIALPAALGLCWVLFRLLRSLPEGTGLASALQMVWGKLVGKALLIIYLIWGLLLLCTHTRFYGQRFLSTGYENTPLFLFIIVLLGLTLWSAWGKLSAFCRAGEIFYLILSFTLALVLFFALFHVEAENVFPIWTEDAPAALRSSLPALSTLGCGTLGAFLAGAVKRGQKDRRRALWWAAAFCLLLTALQFINMGNFGPHLTKRMESPFFMMVKGIGVEGAFQRVESVVAALWALSDLAFAGGLVFALCAMAQSLLGLKQTRSAAPAVVLAALAGALFLFPNAFLLDRFANTVLTAGNLALGFGVPVLTLLAALAREKLNAHI